MKAGTWMSNDKKEIPGLLNSATVDTLRKLLVSLDPILAQARETYESLNSISQENETLVEDRLPEPDSTGEGSPNGETSRIRKVEPKTRKVEPEIRNVKPEIRNVKPEIRNVKPEISKKKSGTNVGKSPEESTNKQNPNQAENPDREQIIKNLNDVLEKWKQQALGIFKGNDTTPISTSKHREHPVNINKKTEMGDEREAILEQLRGKVGELRNIIGSIDGVIDPSSVIEDLYLTLKVQEDKDRGGKELRGSKLPPPNALGILGNEAPISTSKNRGHRFL